MDDGEDDEEQNDLNGSDTPQKNQSSLFGSKRLHSEIDKQKNMALNAGRQDLEKA